VNDLRTIAPPVPMPDLIRGTGEEPRGGGCIMQAAAWLGSDGAWCDMPPCVNRVLRQVAIRVNDTLGDRDRQELWGLLPWLVGTGPTGDRAADNRVNVALAAWAAERVLPLIKDPARNKTAAEHVGRARAWLDNGQRAQRPSAAAYAAAYADAAAYAAVVAAGAAAGAAYAADAAAGSAARIGFLRDLISEYNRVTGRTEPADIPVERWQALRELLPATAGAAR
jgi:hypothetical protein